MSKSKVTHQQAQLLLQLYDLRREPMLREAREWFGTNFHIEKAEDFEKLAPPGSNENRFARMVAGYWEQACMMLNQGLLDEEQFFTTSGEFYMVWQKLEPMAAGVRQQFKNPHFFGSIEEAAKKFERWTEERAPGSLEITRERIQQARQAAHKG